MKSVKKMLALIMVLAMTVAFAACGGSDSSSQKVKLINIALTEEEYAYGVNKDETELLAQLNDFVQKSKEDGTLEEIMNHYFGDGTPVGVELGTEDSAKDQLIIATNCEFAPFEYLDGSLAYGVDMEMMKAFADSLGKELVIKNMEFDSVLTFIDAGYGDVAATGLTKNKEREQYVTFSDSYYNANQMIIVKEDDTRFDDCKDLADVEKVLNSLDSSTKIGAQNGTTGKLYIEGDDGFGFAGLKATAMGYANGALAVQDMLNGNIDFVIIDEAPAKSLVEKFNAVA